MRQEIVNRKLALCDSTAELSIDELTVECPECHEFVLFCCSCYFRNYSGEDSWQRQHAKPCHHFRIVFTDGACLDNGTPNARAGAGVEAGNSEAFRLSIPITDAVDPSPIRSSQRAELIAAKEGLKFLGRLAEMNEDPSHRSLEDDDVPVWIIATDSEYVVKGMTEWVPTWKRRNWRTSKGSTPVNLDLFLALEEEVEKHENANVKVGFWHIPRNYNWFADKLAKEAAGTL